MEASLYKDSIIQSLKVEKIVYKGLGLGYHNRTPVFVYQGLPGDDAAVRVIHKRGEVFFAEIFSYNKRSEYQVPVPCEVFKDCGGCDWLHVAYKDQLRFKQEIVREFFEQFTADKNMISRIIASEKINFYRNKIYLPVGETEYGLTAGIFARRSHRIITHKRCYLQPENSEKIIACSLELLAKANVTWYDEKKGRGTLKYLGLRYSEHEDRFVFIIVTNTMKLPFSKTIAGGLAEKFPRIAGVVQNINEGQSNRILGDKTKILWGRDFLTEKIGEITFKTQYLSFFQINTAQTKNILDYLKKELGSEDVVIDAYSGIGAIGIYIADKVKKVICLEQLQQAVTDGQENCRINGVDNCRFICTQVEKELGYLLGKASADVIILDPPRKGVEKGVIEDIAQSPIRKIIYISCDIATQKRDVELLIRKGFMVKKIQPFDMFPHTYHIENLVIMTR
jgi:23S rRNA (uracil1939-C5)-methyltransferase